MEEKREALAKTFAAPGNEWRAKPFWSWNGELEAEELLRQVHIIQQMGWGGHFMHSRSGLATEYLGEEWFRLIDLVADESERLGLESWLYDEDRWPSGSAGGKVTVDKQYRMKSLTLIESDPDACSPQPDDIALWLVYLGEDRLSMWCAVTLQSPDEAAAAMAAHPQQRPGAWKLVRFAIEEDPCSSNYNGTTYIDTMSEKATRRFIELTHEQYKAHCGDRLGRSILGVFTDEPHRGHGMDDLREENGVRRCHMAWTDDLFSEFTKRYGYDPLPLLPQLFYAPEGRQLVQLRLHYFDLADNLFLERFADPIDRWCHDNGLQFTGHVLHEDSLANQTVPHGSLMRFYEHMALPGVDVLSEGNRCYWIVKQLASTARQTGRRWLLSELYGCTGWQFDFAGHKAVGDWQALLGINLRCPHLSWYTMEGQAKRDYPASMLHQSPWYKDYPLVEDYFARFGVLMQAPPLCDVLVLNPIESVWAMAHLGWANWIYNADPAIAQLEDAYTQLFGFLMGHQVDFDYGEEEMLARLAAVETDEAGRALLRVGEMRYRVVVAGGMRTMRGSTLALLRRFAAAGGCVVFTGAAPDHLDGLPSDAPAALAAACQQVPFAGPALLRAVRQASGQFVEVTGPDGAPAQDVFVQLHRHGEGLYCAAVLNTDREAPRHGLRLTLALPGKQPGAPCPGAGEEMAPGVTPPATLHPQLWDMATGARYDATALCRPAAAGCLCLALDLAAGGSCALVFTDEAEALPPLPLWRPLPWPGTMAQSGAEKDAEPDGADAEGAGQGKAAPAQTTAPGAAKALADDDATALPLPSGPYPYTLDEENVCVLDFVRWRFAPAPEGGVPSDGGAFDDPAPEGAAFADDAIRSDGGPLSGAWQGPAEVLKADSALRDALGLERRGGEMLQPWFAKLHYTQVYGKLQLEYTFTVKTLPDAPVTLAAERPEHWQYALNGVPLAPDGGFWVDICLKRLPIPAGALRLGENRLTATVDFARATNPEAVYLLGRFGVEVSGHAAALTALPATLRFGDLAAQGLPFYTGGLTYHLKGQGADSGAWRQAAAALAARPDARLLLAPGRFWGALVRVDTPAGTTRLGWPPFEADITDALRDGGPVDLTLVGTRRNTFGPLHLKPAYDSAYGPGHFVSEGEHWDDDYILIPSGVEGACLRLQAPR